MEQPSAFVGPRPGAVAPFPPLGHWVGDAVVGPRGRGHYWEDKEGDGGASLCFSEVPEDRASRRPLGLASVL